MKKEGKNENKHLNFHLHSTALCLPKGVHKILKHWLQEGAEKSVTEISIGEKEKKEKLKKEGKMRISILIFSYTEHFAYLKVYIILKHWLH